MTVTQVMGCGIQKGAGEKYRGVEMDVTVLPKIKVEVIIGSIPVEKVVETVKENIVYRTCRRWQDLCLQRTESH